MDDLTLTLERYASRGEPRGSATVLRNAYALMDDDPASLVDVSKPRRPRRRALALAGVLVVAILGLVAWQVVSNDDGSEPVVTTPATGEGLAWVPSSTPDAIPSGFEEAARGSEQGHHWMFSARRFADGEVMVRFAASGLGGGFSVGPKPVMVSSAQGGTPTGGLTPTYTYGAVPAATAKVRISTSTGITREISVHGDGRQFGVRFFVTVEPPVDGVTTFEALAADGHSLGTESLVTSAPNPNAFAMARVTTRIEVPNPTVVGEGTIKAFLVVTNRSGKQMELRTANGCRPKFALAVGNREIPSSVAFTKECGDGALIVPKGVTRFPFSIPMTYTTCQIPGSGGPLPACGGSPLPSLPVGHYRVSFQDDGTKLPTPKSVLVRVVSTNPSLSTRIELPRRTLVAGSEVKAALIVTNRSRTRVLARSDACDTRSFALVVRNRVHPEFARFPPPCGNPVTIGDVPARGHIRIPVRVQVSFLACSTSPRGSMPRCPRGGGPAPLPAGRYTVEFQNNRSELPTPAPVPVRVVRPKR